MYEAQRHWGHESGGKVVLYRQFKCMPELEPYAKAHAPSPSHLQSYSWPAVYHSKMNWEDLLA